MVPSAFVQLQTLPLTANGKIDRKALPEPERTLEQNERLILPRDMIELQLAQIWTSVLNINPIGITSNFFELGGHSLLAVSLMSKIKKQFQIDLPLATLFTSPTIEQLARLLRLTENPLPWSVLVPIKSNGNKTPLFCIHPGGGNVFAYQDLAHQLSLEQPFYGIQSFGLNPQNKPHNNIEQMANHYIQEIKTIQPNGPYFLSGWCTGGLVAFEMAQQLREQDEPIALLALLDSYPLLSASQETEEEDAALLVSLFGGDLDISLEQLSQLRPEEHLIYIVERAKQKNIVSKDFNLAQLSSFLSTIKLNGKAAENYKPKYYSGSMVLFKATENEPNVEDIWNELVGHIEVCLVPGDHINMVKPPHVQILAEKIQNYLNQTLLNELVVEI
jgi:thioesterase domain-containing protein/acyl carrier protein